MKQKFAPIDPVEVEIFYRIGDNFDVLVVLDEQGNNNTIKMYALEACTKFHGNPYYTCKK